MSTRMIIKGNIIDTPSQKELNIVKSGYLIVQEGLVEAVYSSLPEQYVGLPVQDYGDCLIVPGLSDCHVHAPQFVYQGLGLDLQLMQWLEKYAFPTESKFSDLEYAEIYYEAFAKALAAHGTTRAAVFATVHVPATELLMKILEKYRIAAFVGKVNMDTLCPDSLREDSLASVADTKRWILQCRDQFSLVKPAITPRFIPTCSTEVLEGVGKLSETYDLHVHSHLSEDLGEMDIVRSRYPQYDNDSDVYDSFGLFHHKTMMAHFVYPTQHEMELVKERGVTIAHCPQSNVNVAAGLPPIRRMLDLGIRIGLGSDIAGGHSPSIFRAMSDAIMVSKMKWLESGKKDDFLTVPEVFYMGTKGGGQYFGKVGSFEPGYEFDALVIDDSSLNVRNSDYTMKERVERVIHLSDDRHIIKRFTAGKTIEDC